MFSIGWYATHCSIARKAVNPQFTVGLPAVNDDKHKDLGGSDFDTSQETKAIATSPNIRKSSQVAMSQDDLHHKALERPVSGLCKEQDGYIEPVDSMRGEEDGGEEAFVATGTIARFQGSRLFEKVCPQCAAPEPAQ